MKQRSVGQTKEFDKTDLFLFLSEGQLPGFFLSFLYFLYDLQIDHGMTHLDKWGSNIAWLHL